MNLGEVKTVFNCANRLLGAVGGNWKVGRVGLDGVMEEFWERVLQWKGEEGRFMLILLDEADRLFADKRGDPSGLMYRLVRSQDRLEGSGIGLSLIAISNNPLWEIWDMDARVRSSMGVEEIIFQPYTNEDLRQILMNRCREAFAPGVIEDEVFRAFVKYAAEQSRDVRRMVDLLRICGEIAENRDSKRVEMKDFEQARQRLDADYYKVLLDGLAETAKEIMRILAWLTQNENTIVVTTNQLYQSYQGLFGGSTPSYRRIAGVLKELEIMNLIGGRVVSKGRGGRNEEVWLKAPSQIILECLGVGERRREEMLRRVEEKLTRLSESMVERRKS